MADSHHVVVDGSNLATEGRTMPSLAQLDEAVRAYLEEDPEAQITVVVDASFEHRIDESERHTLEQAELAGEVVSPPAGAIGRGDAFVLRIAERTGAKVLSNDSFQEFHGEHPWLFDDDRLVGGKPVPGVGWIFTPRIPVRGAKSRQATDKARRDSARMTAPAKAAELVAATKKVAKRAARHSDGSVPKVGDVWMEPTAIAAAPPLAKSAKKTTKKAAKKVTKKKAAVAPAKKAAKKSAATAPVRKASPAKKSAKVTKKKAAEPVKKAAKKVTKKKAAVAPAKKAAKKATKKAAKKTVKRKDVPSVAKKPAAKKSGGRSRAVAVDPSVRAAIDVALAEALDPPPIAPVPSKKPRRGSDGSDSKKSETSKKGDRHKDGQNSETGGKSGRNKKRRRRNGEPPAAVNGPLAFITFVATYPIGSTFDGTVASFTSHGAMVDVGLPDGSLLHCYVPLTGIARPAPTKAREVLSRGELRTFELVSLDPPRRVAELALPGLN
jgi:Zc3h12a-like Ribonuclease NYN domain